jgi:hypothetical protein
LNGYRANPAAPQDPFRDFDVVYIVTEVAAFRENREWTRRFREFMILQAPEDMGDPPCPATMATPTSCSSPTGIASTFAMCQLFRRVALKVAPRFGFDYPEGDDARVSAHLRLVRSLPKDAKEIHQVDAHPQGLKVNAGLSVPDPLSWQPAVPEDCRWICIA